jgi:hypothetical protein
MSRLLATLLAACTALTAGCADNQETLLLELVPLWPGPEQCEIGATAEEGMPFGRLDVAFDTPYLMPGILLNNSATQATNDNNTGVVSNEIEIKDADVTIDSPQAPELLADLEGSLLSFTVPLATTSLKPGDEVGIAVEVLPLSTVQALRTKLRTLPKGAKLTVRAKVAVNGSRSGNDVGKIGKIKARDFLFPIQLCDGEHCLAYCDGCPGGECPVPLTNEFSGGVCGNAQDFPVTPDGCDPPED